MSGIFTRHGGFPFSVNASGDANQDGTVNDRANLIGNPLLPGGRSISQKLQEWFNTAAFQTPVNSDGNTSRNFLRGPGFVNLGYALIKSVAIPHGPLAEKQKIDFRAEAFNLLNHPNFANPDSAMGDGILFGTITSAQSPRILQFALKYIF